jgi:hypothetical protein
MDLDIDRIIRKGLRAPKSGKDWLVIVESDVNDGDYIKRTVEYDNDEFKKEGLPLVLLVSCLLNNDLEDFEEWLLSIEPIYEDYIASGEYDQSAHTFTEIKVMYNGKEFNPDLLSPEEVRSILENYLNNKKEDFYEYDWTDENIEDVLDTIVSLFAQRVKKQKEDEARRKRYEYAQRKKEQELAKIESNKNPLTREWLVHLDIINEKGEADKLESVYFGDEDFKIKCFAFALLADAIPKHKYRFQVELAYKCLNKYFYNNGNGVGTVTNVKVTCGNEEYDLNKLTDQEKRNIIEEFFLRGLGKEWYNFSKDEVKKLVIEACPNLKEELEKFTDEEAMSLYGIKPGEIVHGTIKKVASVSSFDSRTPLAYTIEANNREYYWLGYSECNKYHIGDNIIFTLKEKRDQIGDPINVLGLDKAKETRKVIDDLQELKSDMLSKLLRDIDDEIRRRR